MEAQKTLADGEKQLTDAKQTLAKGRTSLEEAKSELEAKVQELEDGKAEYETAKKDAEPEITDANKKFQMEKKNWRNWKFQPGMSGDEIRLLQQKVLDRMLREFQISENFSRLSSF